MRTFTGVVAGGEATRVVRERCPMNCFALIDRHVGCGVVAALFLGGAVAGASASPGGEVIEASWDGPDLDRWMYPFNGSPGSRISAPTFGNAGDEQFDNRDGCLLIGFDTASQIPTDLELGAYTILSATVTLEADGQNDTLYDATQDPWQSFLSPDDPQYIADADLGQPVELFGVAYRNGFDDVTFVENSPYGDPFGQGVRNAYAVGFDSSGSLIDVSNNVRGAFDPVPWSIGTADVVPGELVAAGTVFTFALNVSDPDVQDVLRAAVQSGRVRLMVTSMYRSSFDGSQGSGEYPTFYTKENPLVQVDVASAATLQLTVEINDVVLDPADLNGDGVVDVNDLLELLGSWGTCDSGCGPDCPADVNGDCVVDVNDLLQLLASWTP